MLPSLIGGLLLTVARGQHAWTRMQRHAREQAEVGVGIVHRREARLQLGAGAPAARTGLAGADTGRPALMAAFNAGCRITPFAVCYTVLVMSTQRRHMSFRLAYAAAEQLADRARELGEKVTPLAERYVTEGLRMDRHPGIVFRDGAAGRRAALAGHRLDVWHVIETLQASDGDRQAAAAYLGLTFVQVQAAVAYYAAYREEIDDLIARNAEAAEREEAAWRRQQAAFR